MALQCLSARKIWYNRSRLHLEFYWRSNFMPNLVNISQTAAELLRFECFSWRFWPLTLTLTSHIYAEDFLNFVIYAKCHENITCTFWEIMITARRNKQPIKTPESNTSLADDVLCATSPIPEVAAPLCKFLMPRLCSSDRDLLFVDPAMCSHFS